MQFFYLSFVEDSKKDRLIAVLSNPFVTICISRLFVDVIIAENEIPFLFYLFICLFRHSLIIYMGLWLVIASLRVTL
jgi:hypothetical protein